MELNKIYCMDNLELLKQLDDECVDLIYCDILYNTGKKFKDYDDKLGTPQEAIKWYRPRLIEMKRVLKDTGSIYLQCDYRLVHYLKVEMDNIFEISNFRNEIIWKYTGSLSPKNKFPQKHDNIIVYGKSINTKFNQIYEPYKESTINRFDKEDEYGKYRITKRNGKEYKTYLKDGKPMESVWDIPIVRKNSHEYVGYDTQKPKELLRRIIESSSDVNDVVADFFCGSGTSLLVAKELGRQYIGCDINYKAVEITNKRLN